MASEESAGAIALMAQLRAVLGDGALPDVPLRITGRTGLDSPLPVGGLALGAVAAQLLAARAPAPQPLDLDAVHVGLAMRSERFVRLDGRPVGLGFAPLSRFWRTADGWLRLHGNYPHHRAAAIRVLGEDVESAAAGWKAEDLETAIVEAGGAAAAVRTAENWRLQPQGAAVENLHLLSLQRSTDGPPRPTEL